MRHFFITTFERLMNVTVVLTGLGLLALAGKMAMDAQGDTEILLRAFLTLLGGFVALFTLAGSAYLAIGNHQNLRRLVTLMETGGRAAKPLTATRGAAALPRRVPKAAEPLYEDEFEGEDASEPPATPAARFAAAMRPPAIRHAKATPDIRRADLRAPEPYVAEQRVVEPRVTEPRLAEPRLTEPRLVERQVEPQMTAPVPHSNAPQTYAPQIHAAPAFAPLAQPALTESEGAVDDPAPRAGVFSGRGMPKLRSAADQSALESPAPAARHIAQPGTQSQGRAPAPLATPVAAQNGRLVADRRPIR